MKGEGWEMHERDLDFFSKYERKILRSILGKMQRRESVGECIRGSALWRLPSYFPSCLTALTVLSKRKKGQS